MNPLLLSGFGTTINVNKRKLIIQNKLQNKRYEFYPHKINHDSIILDNHTGNISFESMRWLMKHNIQLTLLNWNGNLLAVTLPESPISGKLRIKQYQKYLDEKIRYEIAEKIVFSKINLSVNLLKELANFYEIDIKNVEKTVQKKFQKYQKGLKTEKRPHFSTLMSFEGGIAILYFENLVKIFAKLAPEFNFQARWVQENRKNYNAVDEINALLNYGYAILESEIKKMIHSIGLDPQIGFLHEVLPSKTPLVYDFQELFRWIIDLSVIQLLESQPKLNKNDFILTENYHIRLKEKTAKRLIEKIKNNFNKKAPYKGKNFQYHNILYDNLSKLAFFISEKTKNIDFVVPKITIERNDDLFLQEKILKMTPVERKKLGINKSTLWYMKKNLQSYKNIKIYDKTFSKIKFRS